MLTRAGRLILVLETTRNLVAMPVSAHKQKAPAPDPFGREPFQHPALANIDKLSMRQPRDVVSKSKLARLAMDVGLPEVVRWKPRMVRGARSGLDTSPNQCLGRRRSVANRGPCALTARKPRSVWPDGGAQHGPLRHRWRHLLTTRRRSRPARGQGKDSQEAGGVSVVGGVTIRVYNSVPYLSGQYRVSPSSASVFFSLAAQRDDDGPRGLRGLARQDGGSKQSGQARPHMLGA